MTDLMNEVGTQQQHARNMITKQNLNVQMQVKYAFEDNNAHRRRRKREKETFASGLTMHTPLLGGNNMARTSSDFLNLLPISSSPENLHIEGSCTQ